MSQISAALLLFVAATAFTQHVEHPDGRSDHFHTQDDAGNFNFGYDIGRADGSRDTRQERGDAYGNVVGSYSLLDSDGRSRVVDYTAGEHGFQAVVRTNEPGTANQSPAFVSINSDAPRTGYGHHVPVHRPATPVRRHYPRPTAFRPYGSSYNYDPYYHGRHGYADYSHSRYTYEHPYYHY